MTQESNQNEHAESFLDKAKRAVNEISDRAEEAMKKFQSKADDSIEDFKTKNAP